MAHDVSREVVEKVAAWLPCRCPVVLTADRGFAETHLMAQLARVGGHGRMRLTGRLWIDRPGKRRGKVNRLP